MSRLLPVAVHAPQPRRGALGRPRTLVAGTLADVALLTSPLLIVLSEPGLAARAGGERALMVAPLVVLLGLLLGACPRPQLGRHGVHLLAAMAICLAAWPWLGAWTPPVAWALGLALMAGHLGADWPPATSAPRWALGVGWTIAGLLIVDHAGGLGETGRVSVGPFLVLSMVGGLVLWPLGHLAWLAYRTRHSATRPPTPGPLGRERLPLGEFVDVAWRPALPTGPERTLVLSVTVLFCSLLSVLGLLGLPAEPTTAVAGLLALNAQMLAFVVITRSALTLRRLVRARRSAADPTRVLMPPAPEPSRAKRVPDDRYELWVSNAQRPRLSTGRSPHRRGDAGCR